MFPSISDSIGQPISQPSKEDNSGLIIGLAILGVTVCLSIAIVTFTCIKFRKRKVPDSNEAPIVHRESSTTNINLAFDEVIA